MKPGAVFFLVTVCLPVLLQAQPRPDSLEAQSPLTGAARLAVLADLVETNHRNDPEQAIAYGREALALLARAPDAGVQQRVRFRKSQAPEYAGPYDSVFPLAAPTGPAKAQDRPGYTVHSDFALRQWTARDGLPSNTIRDLTQTRDGYLWMATNEGLVRFDGHRFTVYNATNTPALPGNRIVNVKEDASGRLWILTEQGDLVSYHAGRFTRFDLEIDVNTRRRFMYEDVDTVWVATANGVARYAEGKMQRYQQDLIDTLVRYIVRDAAGRLWVGTTDTGVYRLDPDGTVAHFTEVAGVPMLETATFLEDEEGGMWVTGRKDPGLNEENRVIRIVGDEVTLIHQPKGLPFLRFRDVGGGIWFSSVDDGWWRYDLSGHHIFIPKSNPEVLANTIVGGPDGVTWRLEQATGPALSLGLGSTLYRGDDAIFTLDDQIEIFAFGDEGGVWVGTSTQGLFHLQPSFLQTFSEAEGLPHKAVYAILEDRNGTVWVGTFGAGLARIDADMNVSVIEQLKPTDPPSVYVLALHEDRSGTIWVGGYSQTCRIQGTRCRMDGLPESVHLAARAIYEDRQGRLWIGGENGLVIGRRDGAARTWTSAVSQSGLPAHWVRAITETRDGTLLFATNGGGVLRYNENGDFEAFTTDQGLPSNNVRDLYEDREGYLWIVLEDRGLCRLDRRGQRPLAGAALACLDSQAGLYRDGLHRLLEDDDGRFWFNTNEGIFWVSRAALNAYLDGETAAVTSVSYTEAEGMRNREGNGGVQPAGIKSRDGRLWFPTQDGVVIIDPKLIPDPVPPEVILETVQVGEEERRAEEALVLGAGERDVVFRYTVVEYARPEGVRFQYRLEGYDETWRTGGRERTATYTNLGPGTYTFEVRAALGGDWGATTRLTLEREPYFWERGWFYVLCGLVLVGAVYGAYRWRLRQVEAHNRELEQIVAARTAEVVQQAEALRQANALKSRFLANISHEFRTPLTLTFGPLDDIANRRFASIDEAIPHVERARRNGGRLLRLINQLLDLSKLDAGALLLQAHAHDLARHLRQMAALFDSMAETRDIGFSTPIPEGSFPHVYDADKIEKVVVNLLSNAFKFTPRGGKISLVLAQEADGTARIEVADTGPGIAEEHLPHLFDRFYQVESGSTRAHEGTGIGLALVKELVELHEGTIVVESTVGFGTRFTVRLSARTPTGRAKQIPAPDDEAASTPLGDGLADRYAVEAVLPTLVAVAEEVVPEEATVVLVVEDNADMRAYIRAHLEDHFTIVEAENGRVGLDRAREVVPDLVLSDVMMPEMDGLDLCAALKQDTATSHIPVVLLTARGQVEHRIAGFESGADAYLPKPFNAEELIVRCGRSSKRGDGSGRGSQEKPWSPTPASKPRPRSKAARRARPCRRASWLFWKR